LTIQNVIVRNIVRRGINLYPSTSGGHVITNNFVENVDYTQAIYSAAAPVTISGNTIRGVGAGIGLYPSLAESSGLTLTVTDNTLYDIAGSYSLYYGHNWPSFGIYYRNPNYDQEVIITGNDLTIGNGDEVVDMPGVIGMYIYNADANSLIADNTIDSTGGTNNWGIYLGGCAGTTVDNNDFIMNESDSGIYLGRGNPATPIPNIISDNTFNSTGSTSTGISEGSAILQSNDGGVFWMAEKPYNTDNTITGNMISGFVRGIALHEAASGTYVETGTTADATIHYNSISGNSLYGVDGSTLSATIDAEYNWWGSPSGPGPVGPGTGDKVSANVDYDPWLGSLPGVWTKYTGNPVVTGSMALDPVVLKEGSTYKMWYTHVDGSDNWTIYYADSSDGVTWSNQQQVLGPSGTDGAYDEMRVAGPSVINDSGTYKMWFSARDVNAAWTVGYATSSDGISWTKVGKVMDVGAHGEWDSQIVREPSVIKDGTTYKMWYAGSASWPVFKIGYATSTDGTTWTKHVSNPIFTGTTSSWDEFQVYAPSVVLDGGVYHLFFSGTDNSMSQKWSTGFAASGDGITWTEGSRNPILIPDGTDDSLDYVSAMNDGGTWKIWYSYGGNYAIGLATLTSDTQLWLDPAVASVPNDNATTQSFTVMIANAVDLYGYQFVITFDQTNLEATAAAFDNSFFSSFLGSPPGWNATIDNVNGKIFFARSRQNPDLPLSGDGPLATVTFRSTSGASVGSYKIGFEQDILADIDINELSHTSQYAWLVLHGVGNLQGSVDLQGRSDESGGTVTIMTSGGYTASTPISAVGSWSFANVPIGSYQVNVEMARYLDAQKGDSGSGVSITAGGTTTLNQVKLLGGDADDSDQVDIGDAAIIGGQFGKTGAGILDVRADINNDGAVNILDLVLLGGNFDKTSPVNWP